MWTRTAALAAALALSLAACRAQAERAAFPEGAPRDVAPIVSNTFSTEDARDRARRGGAGHSPCRRQAGNVGRRRRCGRGLLYGAARACRWREGAGACRGHRARSLAIRSATGSSANSSTMSRSSSERPTIRCFPRSSFDRVFLVHMYHEVQSPYAFLWHIRDAVKPDGEFIVVDSDRPMKRHGTPPAQLKCEFAALGAEAGEIHAAERRRGLFDGLPRLRARGRLRTRSSPARA